MASADAWFWLGPEAADRAIEELARHDLVAEYAGSRPDLTVIHVKGETDVGDRAARLLQQAGIEPRRPENGDIPIGDRSPNNRWIDVCWADTLDRHRHLPAENRGHERQGRLPNPRWDRAATRRSHARL